MKKNVALNKLWVYNRLVLIVNRRKKEKQRCEVKVLASVWSQASLALTWKKRRNGM